MNRRHTISREFFSTIAVVLVLGLSVMCAIQTALSAAYFVNERRAALTAILDGAAALTERFAEAGYIVTEPLGDDRAQSARRGYELFNTASGAMVFVTAEDGSVLLHTNGAEFTARPVPQELLNKMDEGEDLFITGTLDGVYTDKYYTAGRRIDINGTVGYLFAASPMTALGSYIMDMLVMFGISAVAILLLCSLLCWVLARRITGPIEAISDAARKLGSGDFTARAPVDGCVELADFATTFNNMATRLQTIDNSRGQFMGNIAHELRTPMTTIQGFIDGMLDGTIPPQEQKKYLEIVSQETGRLSRLVKNMLDITKLEAGEYQVHARSYNIWDTVTDVVLSDEQRIEDAKIDIQGLGGGKTLVYTDPDFVHQVVYNIVDNAIKFTPPGGVIRFAEKRLGDKIELSIENTGAGISADALPFVFDRFYKEDRSRGLNARGSGLGLHICKVLVNLSGGDIRVESEEGKWCRFTFSLPAGDAKKAEEPAASGPIASGKAGRR